MQNSRRCRALARAVAVLAFTLPTGLALTGIASAGPLAKKPSPSASPTPSPTSSATAAATRATPSPTASPTPSATRQAHGNRHPSPSPAAPSPTATATHTTAPSPSPTVAAAKGNKHRISPSPSPSPARPSPSASSAAPRPIGPTIPAFIGPVASRSVRPPAPLAFVGPVPRHHAAPAHPSATRPPAVRPAVPATQATGPVVGVVPGTDVLPTVHSLVRSSVRHPQAPLSLGAIVLLFLLVQHRIDRRDPKLVVVPHGDNEELKFGTTIRYA